VESFGERLARQRGFVGIEKCPGVTQQRDLPRYLLRRRLSGSCGSGRRPEGGYDGEGEKG